VSYAIRRPSSRLLTTVLGLAAFFAFAILLVKPPTIFFVVAAVIAGWNLWSSSLVVSVGRRGVRFGRGGTTTLVPLSSIREVVLWNAGPAGLGGGEPEVGLRLRPGAPLPDSMGSLIQDPARPDEVPRDLRMRVPRLDRGKLEAAVREHGGVPVVDA
jgi:hypothetical protein